MGEDQERQQINVTVHSSKIVKVWTVWSSGMPEKWKDPPFPLVGRQGLSLIRPAEQPDLRKLRRSPSNLQNPCCSLDCQQPPPPQTLSQGICRLSSLTHLLWILGPRRDHRRIVRSIPIWKFVPGQQTVHERPRYPPSPQSLARRCFSSRSMHSQSQRYDQVKPPPFRQHRSRVI